MPERPRLEIVDDPVVRAADPAALGRRGIPTATKPAPQNSVAEPSSLPAAAEPTRAPERRGYRDEEKRAVFGRVPRSLSRRLERAVVELREDIEDLTQEQLLAALLYQHVEPSEPDRLKELAQTVQSYRARL